MLQVVIVGMGADRGTLLTGACCVKEVDLHGSLRCASQSGFRSDCRPVHAHGLWQALLLQRV